MNHSKRRSRQQPSEKFGAYLKGLRERKTTLSQVEAAGQLGLSRQRLNQYEKGTRVPPYHLLIRLAHLYHVPTAEILEMAYWPQLILVPLVAIIDPEQLSRDLIEELERGLEEAERQELTHYIEELLGRRSTIT